MVCQSCFDKKLEIRASRRIFFGQQNNKRLLRRRQTTASVARKFQSPQAFQPLVPILQPLEATNPSVTDILSPEHFSADLNDSLGATIGFQ
jgi:hypothetical protein